VGGTTLTTDAYGAHAILGMKWLLYDFGAREAGVASAKETLLMANVGFNAEHQKVVFEVTRLFYSYNVVRQKVAVAEDTVQSAHIVRQAAQAKVQNGLGTQTDLLQAEEADAQAAFDLDTARGALSDAQVALVESLGLLPTTQVQVADILGQPLARKPEENVDTLVDRALTQRPDLVAKLAEVHARREEVRKARADGYLPKITLEGNAGYADLNVSVNGSDYLGAKDPIYKVGVNVELPVFDGFARENKLRLAESQLRAAESELSGARDAVVREVWQAYTDFLTALQKQESSTRLRIAAENSAAASLQSYQTGLGNYVDVVGTQRTVATARGVDVDTRAAIYTRAAALALSIGDLDRPGSRLPFPGTVTTPRPPRK
jgi:outer membrane protein TolC